MNLYQSFCDYIAKLPGVEVQNRTDNRMVYFRYNNLNFTFICNQEQQQYYYFRLILPKVANCDDNTCHQIDDVNRKFKVGKAFIYHDEVWFSFEQFVVDPEMNGPIFFARAISILENMIRDWRRIGIDNNRDNKV